MTEKKLVSAQERLRTVATAIEAEAREIAGLPKATVGQALIWKLAEYVDDHVAAMERLQKAEEVSETCGNYYRPTAREEVGAAEEQVAFERARIRQFLQIGKTVWEKTDKAYIEKWGGQEVPA